MPRPAPVQRATLEEYLRLEETSSVRHELVDGMLFAMAGGTDYHNTITVNILVAVRSAARAHGCFAFASDMKLLAPDDITYYPDVFVTCDEENTGARVKRSACFVVEVLSESTSDIDRGEKLLNYRKIPGLQAYILISQTQKLVEVYRRLGDGAWRYETLEDEGSLDLPGLNASLTLEAIYEDVRFTGLGRV